MNIVSWDGGGLGVDIDVVSAVLKRLGCEVAFKGRARRRSRNRLRSVFGTGRALLARQIAGLARRPLFDLTIFIESVFPEFLPTTRTSALLVNPEWFRDENAAFLSRLDWILCKTPGAVELFEDASAQRRYVAFTSPDKRRPEIRPAGALRCLHVSGASALKGTEAVVEVWARNPRWPELTVVRRERYDGELPPPLPPLPNVRYETRYLPAEHLTILQNACAVHVIPSQAEGYGHAIAEGMSCGAVVVTTDAPPMNELVTADRGVLVRVGRSESMRRGRRYFVDADDLEARLNSVFAMGTVERETLGRRARTWYESEAARFEDSMRRLIGDALARRDLER